MQEHRIKQELNLIEFGSGMQNLDSYPLIHPVIMSILKDAVAKNNFQTRKSAIPLHVHRPLSDAPVKLSDELIANVSIPAENVTALYNANFISPPVSPPRLSEKKRRSRRKGKSDRTKTLRRMELALSSASSGTFRVMTPKTTVTVDPRVVHDY
jgi:hypothetical protein